MGRHTGASGCSQPKEGSLDLQTILGRGNLKLPKKNKRGFNSSKTSRASTLTWLRGQWQQRRLLQLPCAAKPWEEKRGKKNKDTVMGILASQRHFTYPPFSHLSCQQIRCQISHPSLSVGGPEIIQLSLSYSNASAKHNNMYHFAELYQWNNYTIYYLLCGRTGIRAVSSFYLYRDHKGDIRKGVQEHLPHAPLLSGSVPKSPGWRKLFNCSNKKQTMNPADQKPPYWT